MLFVLLILLFFVVFDLFLEIELCYECILLLQFGLGYVCYEIEGIGGVVKRKFVCMVKVGVCVFEYEDEKGLG